MAWLYDRLLDVTSAGHEAAYLGAIVVKHELKVSEHVYKTAALEKWSWNKGVISTYLRIEVPHPKAPSSVQLCVCTPHSHTVAAAPCSAHQAIPGQSPLRVTGAPRRLRSQAPLRPGAGGPAVRHLGRPDTSWIHDFVSCTLAKPTLLSVSGCAAAHPVQQAASPGTLRR